MALSAEMKTAIFLLVFLVSVFNIPIGLSYAQRDQPLISGGGRFGNPGSRLEPSDLANGNTTTLTTTLSNPQMVIKLLSSMAPDDIQKFPLKDIPTDELLIVLNGLPIPDLFKTLENIPAADLVEIFDKFPQDKSQAILNRLPQDQSQEILNRITGELTK
jgi:hypothetical protein